MKFYTILLSVFVLLAGCADVEMGNDAANDFGRYTQLEKGASTKQTVYSLFGQPSDVNYSTDGTSEWIVVSVQTRTAGVTFVPFIGILAGGQRQNIRESTFSFDRLGRYTSVETKQQSVYENQWAMLGRAGASFNSPAFQRVEAEMNKLGLPYDKNTVFPPELYNNPE